MISIVDQFIAKRAHRLPWYIYLSGELAEIALYFIGNTTVTRQFKFPHLPLKPLRFGNKKGFAVGLPHNGIIFSENSEKFLAIKSFSVNDTMSGQPNKCLIHWHFEN